MSHTPYGYKIENGVAVIDDEKAEKIRKLYKGYLTGLALTVAAKQAGIDTYHGTAGRMLRNARYLGDEYYPAVIDREIFDAVETERQKRAVLLGRIRESKPKEESSFPTNFYIDKITNKYQNPFKQAEYVYSQIVSEVIINGK